MMERLEYLINKFYELVDRIGKHNFILIAFVVIVVIITGLYSTFSLFTTSEGISDIDGLKTYKFVLNPELSENYSVIIPALTEKNIDIVISNDEDIDMSYLLYYTSSSSLTDFDCVYLSGSEYTPSGVVESGKSNTVNLLVTNDSNSNITIEFNLLKGFENDEYLEVPSGGYSINEESYGVNAPKLDDGLIPVYYDSSVVDDEGYYGVWKRADESNSNNSWYNYDNKMWANAIMINDDVTRDIYLNADVGTVIPVSDIDAFLVWIPRFKYRVWNITRQAGNETTYAYSAYNKGIDIMWEKDLTSTGNVKCTYNTASTESSTNLSDVCVYNAGDTITTTSGNKNYTNAWYTHPAFTFGTQEVSGFWIGKFETTGTADEPTVLPDVVSLASQNVSTQFTTAKKFQYYGISNNLDAHMLTNLEWGAVAYLTHSVYGLCNGSSCSGGYINNSSGYYTGRSGGAIAGSTSLNLTTVYGSSNTTSTTKYNTNGYYTYRGNFIDYNGNITSDVNTLKIASSTGNVTGVYDMVGGHYEYVMANMVDSSNVFYPSSSGTNWNENASLGSKYYNSYSYGTAVSSQAAFNRSRLGDAIGEVLGTTGISAIWKSGSGVTGGYSYFVYSTYPWLSRGGYYSSSYSSFFSCYRYMGTNDSYYAFRLAIS